MRRGWIRSAGRVAVALCLSVTAAAAQEERVIAEDYADLARTLGGRLDFEGFGAGPEPGITLDGPITAPGVSLGERLSGTDIVVREVQGGVFDAPGPGRPDRPLAVAPGAPGRNLSVAQHRGFGSAALFPLGPAGWPALGARGEGMVTLLFADDQPAIGLKLHADYPDPLGSRPAPGEVLLVFFDRSGRRIGFATHIPAPGVNALAWRSAPGAPPFAAVTIYNADPGGIAIDDVIYALPDLTG